MFTSRAEFRLHLRPDNADSRLTTLGYEEAHCVSSERFQEYTRQGRILEESQMELKNFKLTMGEWAEKLSLRIKSKHETIIKSAWEILKRTEIADLHHLANVLPVELRSRLSPLASCHCGPLRLQIQCLYEKSLEKQTSFMEEIRADEALELPDAIDYGASDLSGLSSEVVEKLEVTRPATLGAASRIQGMTPSALSVLLHHVKRKRSQSYSI